MTSGFRTSLLALCFVGTVGIAVAEHWPQFRGPSAAGVALDQREPPREWSEAKNIAWKVELPGRGPSSPILVGNRAFVTCSAGARQNRLMVLAFDVETGSEVWRREFWATGSANCHPSSANAAPTPASDGQRIFALYSSNDFICLDLDGNLIWYRALALDYPKTGNDVGMSSSPTVIGDTVVVQIENQGNSFAAGIDARTGRNHWRIHRPAEASWCSPVIVSDPQGTPTLVLQSGEGISAHDPATGEEKWSYPASCDLIASPSPAKGRLFFPASGLSALKVPGPSEDPELAWDATRLGTGASSPVVDGDRVYTVNRSGVLNCASVEDGELLWTLRLEITQMWATPVIVGQLMFCIDNAGQVAVVQLGDDKAQIVGRNELGESIQASPAVANGAIYFRSDQHLWKIAAD